MERVVAEEICVDIPREGGQETDERREKGIGVIIHKGLEQVQLRYDTTESLNIIAGKSLGEAFKKSTKKLTLVKFWGV